MSAVSYVCAAEDQAGGEATPRYHYRVQFWAFRHFEPLVKRAEVSLFGSHREGVQCWGSQARLSIFEAPNERFFVAHCTVPPSSPEESGTPLQRHDATPTLLGMVEHFVSLFESPLAARRPHAVLCTSFSYLGASTVPYVPLLTFLRPNLLVLNTGSGLRFLSLSLSLRELVSSAAAEQNDELSVTMLPLSDEPPCRLPSLDELRCPGAWLREDAGLLMRGTAVMAESKRPSDSRVSTLAVRTD